MWCNDGIEDDNNKGQEYKQSDLVTHDTNEEAVRYYLAGRQPDPLKLLELWNRGKEVLEIGL